MFDDVTVGLDPANAQAVAGYVNGRYANFDEVVKKFPNAKHLSISVTSTGNAECLDVERGDATNDVVAAWVKRQSARGVYRPVVYTSLSNAQTLVNLLAKEGLPRTAYRLWTAHYSGRAHICGPTCGFGLRSAADATQFTDRALGHSLDESMVNVGFFDFAKPKPVPKPAPKPVPAPPVVPPTPKPAPKPVTPASTRPAPIPKGKIQVRLLDKDMQEHYELTNAVGFLKRAAQFAKGMFREFGAKRSL